MGDPARGPLLSGPGTRVLISGTGAHPPSSILTPVPAVRATVNALGRCLTERANVDPANLTTVIDPQDPRELGEALTRAAQEATSTLLFFYVGHGLVDAGNELHLATQATVDLEVGIPGHQALPYSAVRGLLSSCRAEFILVVLDCCFAGRARGISPRAGGEVFDLPTPGAYLLTAASRDESAWVLPGARYTAFTGELIALLDEGDPTGPPDLSLDHVYRNLARSLPAKGLPRPRRQATDLGGHQIIGRNPAYVPRAVPGPPAPVPDTDEYSPYRGLSSFDTADARLFFGRDELTAELLDRVRDDGAHPVLVTGPSGAGKSSLLRAGLVPTVEHAVPGSRCVVFTPGNDPVAELDRRVRGISGADGLVTLLVDQFEELFTTRMEERRREEFVHGLAALNADPGRRVVLGLRSDFFGHCAAFPDLLASLAHPLVVGPMSTRQLRESIERPAEVLGLSLEHGLTDLLLEDLGTYGDASAGDVGVLPLLSHALLVTWQHRENGVLTLAAYRATGGIAKALANTADRTLHDLGPPGEPIARRVLPRLVRLGEGATDTRRKVPLRELNPDDDPAIGYILGEFVQSRLVTVDGDTAAFTHEAIIPAWPRLQAWIQDDRAELLVRQHLAEDAADWLGHGKDPAYLYAESRLAGARKTASAHQAELTATEREFLDAAVQAEQTELSAARRRTRWFQLLSAGLSVLLVVAVVAGGVAAVQTRRAEEARVLGLSQLLANEALLQLSTRLDTAMLLAVESSRVASTFEARQALFRMHVLAPPGQRHLWTPKEFTADVRVSGDGSLVLTHTLSPRRITVRDLASGKVAWNRGLRDRTAVFTGFTTDGGVAVGYEEPRATGYTIDRWDARTGASRGTVTLEKVAASGGGNDVVSADSGTIAGLSHPDPDWRRPASVRVWDVPSRRLIREVPAGSSDVTFMALSPDGRLLVTAAKDGSVTVLNVRTGRKLGRLSVPDDPIIAVGVANDGRRVALDLGLGGVRLFDPATGAAVGRAPLEGSAQAGAFTPSSSWGGRLAFADRGSLLTRAGFDGSLRLWETVTGRPLTQPLAVGAASIDHAVGPGGSFVVTADGTERLTVWDTAARQPGHALSTGPGGTSQGVDLAMDASHYVHQNDRAALRVTEIATGRGQDVALPQGVKVAALGVARGGRLVAAADEKGDVILIDRDSGRKRTLHVLGEGQIDRGFTFSRLVLSPTGHYLAVVLALDNVRAAVLVFDLVVNEAVWSRPRQGDGFIVTTQGGLAFSADERLLAVGEVGKKVEVVSLPSGDTAWTASIDSDFASSLAFSSDARLLATGDTGGGVIVWDTQKRARVAVLPGMRSFVTGVGFSEDARVLAAGNGAGDLSIWDLDSRRLLSPPFQAAPGRVTAIIPGSGGYLVASADGSLSRWTADPAKIREELCRAAGRNLSEAEWRQFVPGEPYRRTCEQWPAGGH